MTTQCNERITELQDASNKDILALEVNLDEMMKDCIQLTKDLEYTIKTVENEKALSHNLNQRLLKEIENNKISYTSLQSMLEIQKATSQVTNEENLASMKLLEHNLISLK